MGIEFFVSPALDAVALCWWMNEVLPDVLPLQREVLEEMESRLNGEYSAKLPSFSTVSAQIYGRFADISALSLEELADWLADAALEGYADGVRKLAQAGFAALWEEKVRPAEVAQINRLRGRGQEDSALLNRLSALKNQPEVELSRISVVISLMAYPISFQLSSTAFLNCLLDSPEYISTGFAAMLAHELLHGFASPELLARSRELMESHPKLRACRRSLYEDFRSGDEEELVMAGEYFLLWRMNILPGEEIFRRALSRYSGCCPLSAALFAHLVEHPPVADLDGVLREIFARISPEFVLEGWEKTFSALKLADEDSFFNALFARMHQCGYWVRALGESENPIARTGDWEERPGPVAFGAGELALPEGAVRRVLMGADYRLERIAFAHPEQALAFQFPICGTNFAVPSVEIGGKRHRLYFVNVAWPEGGARVEISFVCRGERVLLSLDCREDWADVLAAVRRCEGILAAL